MLLFLLQKDKEGKYEDKEKAIDRIKSYLKELFGDNLPNLMNKFIYDASDDHEPFSTGGSKEVTLTKENLPEHSHYYSGSYIWENSRENIENTYGCKEVTHFDKGSQSGGSSDTFVYKTGQKGLFNPQPKPIPIQPEFIVIPFIIRIY